jgi:hypothetical protein
MELKTTVLVGVLAGLLLSTPMLVHADEARDISILIEKAKNSTFLEKFEIISEIKAQLATMNDDDRAVAMAKIEVARESIRSGHD